MKLVTVTYKPPQGEIWVKQVTPEVAEKMVKLGRWKLEKKKPEKDSEK
jgi:hypothetical protein